MRLNDFKADAARFADVDAGALRDALLALKTCPNCRGDLLPVAFCADVFGCAPCKETWFVPSLSVKEGR